jgi:hypothetical protein
MNSKAKGNLAVATVIRHFVSEGYTVSLPLGDSAKYDLVVEHKGRFQAVQCKYAGYEGNPGIYSAPLYVCGGNRSAGNRRVKYDQSDFDLLYILCANGRSYLIPVEEVAGMSTVNVGRNSKWSKWENYVLHDGGDNCSPAEESVGDNSSNSVKPAEMVTPSQASGA